MAFSVTFDGDILAENTLKFYCKWMYYMVVLFISLKIILYTNLFIRTHFSVCMKSASYEGMPCVVVLFL